MILTSMLLAAYIHCQSFLVGEDAHPYSHMTNEQLLELAADDNVEVLKELAFREQVGMLKRDEYLNNKEQK